MGIRQSKYDDKYPTCLDTFVTLRIESNEVDPERVAKELRITPSSVQTKGHLRNRRKIELNAWFLSSERNVKSKDSRRHIDWLLAKLHPKRLIIKKMCKKGFRIDISCYWTSTQGHGGPTLSTKQLVKLGELGIDFSYDFYS